MAASFNSKLEEGWQQRGRLTIAGRVPAEGRCVFRRGNGVRDSG